MSRRAPRQHAYRLLLYERVVGRQRGKALFLALALLALWALVSYGWVAWPQPPADAWLLAGGFVSLAYWLLARFGPRRAYVQPREDHLRVQTPIYRLKISYRRIRNTRPVEFGKLMQRTRLSRAERRLLTPFANRTALGVDLSGWPLSPRLLRLFLSRFTLAPDETGLVLLVDDWMGLSNQLASRMDTWRAAQQVRPRGPGIGAGDILHSDDR